MDRIIRFAVKTAASAFVATAALIPFVQFAHALTYSVSYSGPNPLTQLGDQIGNASIYDQLSIQGLAGGTFGVGTINLDLLGFTAGVNATVPQAVNSYSFSETLTLSDGSGANLIIPFNVNINYSDILTIAAGSPVSFTDSVGTLWQIALNSLTIGPNAGGPTQYATLTAQVTDPPAVTPLPAALPLFASGIGVMGLFGWWRKRKSTASNAAA